MDEIDYYIVYKEGPCIGIGGVPRGTFLMAIAHWPADSEERMHQVMATMKKAMPDHTFTFKVFFKHGGKPSGGVF
jgi:hypothetical protein